MTPKQLAIASLRVLKMLREKPVPYKWTQLQKDSRYTVDELRLILGYLCSNEYVKKITFVDVIVTEKGMQAKSYAAQQFDKWYQKLPAFYRYLLSPATAGLAAGAILFFFLSMGPDERPRQKSILWENVYIATDSINQINFSQRTPRETNEK